MLQPEAAHPIHGSELPKWQWSYGMRYLCGCHGIPIVRPNFMPDVQSCCRWLHQNRGFKLIFSLISPLYHPILYHPFYNKIFEKKICSHLFIKKMTKMQMKVKVGIV